MRDVWNRLSWRCILAVNDLPQKGHIKRTKYMTKSIRAANLLMKRHEINVRRIREGKTLLI